MMMRDEGEEDDFEEDEIIDDSNEYENSVSEGKFYDDDDGNYDKNKYKKRPRERRFYQKDIEEEEEDEEKFNKLFKTKQHLDIDNLPPFNSYISQLPGYKPLKENPCHLN